MKKLTRYFFAGVFIFLTFKSIGQQLQYPTAVSANSGSLVARQPDSRAWSDPALNHNRLLQQQTGEGVYILIGPYKVIGSPFLYGEHHPGDLFSTETKAFNIHISYNTFNQELEFYSTSNPDKPLIREPGTLDSFVIQKDESLKILSPLKFVYGTILGSKEKAYFLEMVKGDSYSLYKRYKSELDYVGTNLAQSELRQFDLKYDYYYVTANDKSIHKIKPTYSSFVKEFKRVMDLSVKLKPESFENNPEEGMRMAMFLLNK